MVTLKVESNNSKAAKVVKPLAKSTKSSEKTIGGTYGTGRRKSAVARVWLRAGSGKIVVNKQSVEKYFTRESHNKSLLQPFVLSKTSGQYDVICTVKGGGVSGQVGAVLHGIARAMDKLVPEFHGILRQGGFLTRDSRVVERKKYGKHKARKSTQFSKR